MLDKFFTDSRVLSLMKSDTVFEILSLKEENSSKLLAWLLDPKESHGVSNKFALHLLNACADKGKVRFYTSNGGGELNVGKTDCFKNAFVWSEYPVTDCQNGRNGKTCGRIDILLIDAENKLSMVIENKYGSKEHDSQCKTYKKALMQLCRKNPDMKFVFIYLDVQGGACPQKEFYNLSYDAVLDFKAELQSDSIAWRLVDSLEKDVNGIEADEKLVKELNDAYGDELEKYKETFERSNKKEILDTWFKNGDIDVLTYAEYEGVVNDILEFRKHKSKVFAVRHSAEFKDFIARNGLDFSQSDYETKGRLTFSRDCFCNENDDGKWAVYGDIEQGKNGYALKLIYWTNKDDAAMQKKLKSVLNGNNSHSKTYITTTDLTELFKAADLLVKDLDAAEKLI
ncbi:MAG TPA: hypothetical protein DCX19_00590 [Alphaproteobacteria bacterium]|nr:hypothetical protein [Alphaproteobacteria bacterium]